MHVLLQIRQLSLLRWVTNKMNNIWRGRYVAVVGYVLSSLFIYKILRYDDIISTIK